MMMFALGLPNSKDRENADVFITIFAGNAREEHCMHA